MENRIVQLDGLRALAFLSVLICHLGVFRAGGMGVDLFFVLSGFLITSILRRRRAEQHPLRGFYANRARRILPPYLICLAFCAALFFIDWRHVWFFYALPLENIAAAYHSSQIASLHPLWSLAIEEQFYLLWPLLVFTLPRRTLLYILASIILVSPILRFIATPFFPDYLEINVLTPFRLDPISIGSLIALLYESEAARETLKRYGKPLFFMGVAALFAGSYFGWHIETNSYLTNSLGYSAVAFMSAGLLIWATIGKGWLYRLLVIRPLRFIGTISYTAYVIHVPMIQLLQDWGALHGDRHGARLAAASVPLTLLFASVSWYAIERPILRWNHRTRKPDAGISLAAEQPGSSS